MRCLGSRLWSVQDDEAVELRAQPGCQPTFLKFEDALFLLLSFILSLSSSLSVTYMHTHTCTLVTLHPEFVPTYERVFQQKFWEVFYSPPPGKQNIDIWAQRSFILSTAP